MNIEMAIEHCLDKGNDCTECGKEHLQLAEWLQELKDLSILAFRYYLQLMFATEAYVQGRAAQIETKFWLQPYKPKDKYDGLLTQMDMQKMKIK